MSNVIETVTSILEMDEEIESLRVQNTLLKEAVEQKRCNCNHTEIGVLDKIAIKYGRKQMVRNILYYENTCVRAKREGENIIYTDFIDFATSFVEYNDERIPIESSVDEVIEYFREELQEKYKIKCKKAYEDLLNQEKEESEEDE